VKAPVGRLILDGLSCEEDISSELEGRVVKTLSASAIRSGNHEKLVGSGNK